MNIFLTVRKFIYINGHTTKRHLGPARCLILRKSLLEHYAPWVILSIVISQILIINLHFKISVGFRKTLLYVKNESI